MLIPFLFSSHSHLILYFTSLVSKAQELPHQPFNWRARFVWGLALLSSTVHGCQACTMANHDHPPLITTPRLPVQSGGNLETKNFLDCPFEIRTIIYKDFFAAEFCESGEVRPELG